MSKFLKSLSEYVRAAYPIIVVETHEESRVIMDIAQWAQTTPHPVVYWDFITGLHTADGEKVGDAANTHDPMQALRHIAQVSVSTLFVIKDMHEFVVSRNPQIIRLIRNMINDLKEHQVTLLFLSPRFNVPEELSKDVQFLEFELPDRASHRLLITSLFSQLRVNPEYAELVVTDDIVEMITDSLTGLTHIQAENALALAIVKLGSNRLPGPIVIDAEYARHVFSEKVQVFKQSLLEYIPTHGGFESVGGLDNMKRWATLRKSGFTQAARDLNLPYPKGVLLAGVRGGGKSISASAIAHEFNFPLFKLDVGRLFGSKVGETEANTREVIRLIEGLGNVVVLIDEMEKYLNRAATSGQGDSGTGSRMFGTLLTWMATKKCPAFLIGTVNDITVLPVELIRKGRFDDLFYVDLPSADERISIFRTLLHLKFKRNILTGPWVDKELMDDLSLSTTDFTGAEIEGCIEEALYLCLHSGGTMNDEKLNKYLNEVCRETKPQARINPAHLKEQRDIAVSSYRMASSVQAKNLAIKTKRKITSNDN